MNFASASCTLIPSSATSDHPGYAAKDTGPSWVASVVNAIGQRKVLAFAGIADPEKFFATLTSAGIQVANRAGFPDHHRFGAAEALDLVAQAQANNLMLLTTEKDLARLAGEPEWQQLATHASALPVRLVIEEQDRLREIVLSAVANYRATALRRKA